MENNNNQALTETVENIEEEISAKHPSLGNILKRFSRRGFGALLLLPATLVVLPTGAIPGMPAICGALVILFSLQIIFGRSVPWVPKRIKSIEFKSQNISKVTEMLTPYTKKIDSYIYPRWNFAFHSALDRIYGLIMMILGGVIIVFGFIPFAVIAPGVAMLLLALGLTVKDGLLAMLGVTFFAGCVFVMPYVMFTTFSS